MVSSYLVTAAISLFPLAFAQYTLTNSTTTAAAPSGTGTAGAPVQTVAVGKDGFRFTPDTIQAKPGEEIIFEFFPKNHAVVEAEFNTPCKPANGGIFSGFIPSESGPAVSFFLNFCERVKAKINIQNKTFTIKVTDDRPIWLYCPQNLPVPHCAAGMVAVINPPPTAHNALDTFRLAAAATNATGSVVPSGGPSGGEVSTPGSKPGASSSSPSPSGTSSPESPGAGSSLAVNSVVGLVAVFAALVV